MNEEQLADILAEHLEALLAGESLPEPPPAEIAELLALTETLTTLTPKAPPEFGVTLKSSLLGSKGSTPVTGGFTLGGGAVLLIGIVALGIVAALLLVAGGIAWHATQTPPIPASTPSIPVETGTEPKV